MSRIDEGGANPPLSLDDQDDEGLNRLVDPRLNRKVQSAVQQISTLLAESILDGSLRPGDRLPSEEVMAENHGVSRPTMRLALRALRVKGAIRVVRGPKGGHIVAEMAPAAIADGLSSRMSLALDGGDLTYEQISEVRDHLEILSAGLAAERRTEGDVRDLLALDELRAVDPSDDPGTRLDLALRYDMYFHRRLAECTHNPLVMAFASGTIIAFQDRDVDVLGLDGDHVLRHLDDVRGAVVAQDRHAAEEAMRRHLVDARPRASDGKHSP